MKLSSTDIGVVEKAVSLLLKFLNFYDGLNDEQDEASNYNQHTYIVSVQNENNEEVKELNVPYHQTLKYLRNLIAQAFGISS